MPLNLTYDVIKGGIAKDKTSTELSLQFSTVVAAAWRIQQKSANKLKTLVLELNNKDTSTFTQHLQYLYQNLRQFHVGEKWNVLLNIKKHWMLLRFEIRSQSFCGLRKNLSVTIIDPAGSQHHIVPAIIKMQRLLGRLYINLNVHVFLPYSQVSSFGCEIFALHALWELLQQSDSFQETIEQLQSSNAGVYWQISNPYAAILQAYAAKARNDGIDMLGSTTAVLNHIGESIPAMIANEAAASSVVSFIDHRLLSLKQITYTLPAKNFKKLACFYALAQRKIRASGDITSLAERMELYIEQIDRMYLEPILQFPFPDPTKLDFRLSTNKRPCDTTLKQLIIELKYYDEAKNHSLQINRFRARLLDALDEDIEQGITEINALLQPDNFSHRRIKIE